MTIHLAGGIRNPKTTSYLNCTLQMFFYFQPFIELLEDESLQDETIIKILKILVKNVNSTENSISADSLISFFSIDPSIFCDIWTFIHDFYEKLPIQFQPFIGMFDLDKISEPTHINYLITKEISNSVNLNEYKLLLFHIPPNEEFPLLLEDQLNVAGKTFQLFSFIQISPHFQTPTNGQYTILMRDSEGWIFCNDTSITAVSDSQQAEIRSLDLKAPIEVIAYIDSIDSVHFNRRPVHFPAAPKKKSMTAYESNSPSPYSLFNSPKSDQNDDDDVSEIGSTKSPQISPSKMYSKPSLKLPMYSHPNKNPSQLFQESSSDDDDDEIDFIESIKASNEGSSKKLIGKFFEGKEMKIINEQSIEVDENTDYQIAANTLKFQFEEDYHANLEYKFFVDNQFVNSPPELSQTNVTAIYMRDNMPFFDNRVILKSNLVTIQFIVLETAVTFSGQFVDQQTVQDVISYITVFQQQILKAKNDKIYVFLMIKGKAYQLSTSLRINEISTILGTYSNLTFGITFNEKNPRQLFTFEVPLYETEKHFKLIHIFQHPVSVRDQVHMLVSQASKILKNDNLDLMWYDHVNKKFTPFDGKPYLMHIANTYENFRIQKKIQPNDILFVPMDMDGIVPFFYRPPPDLNLKQLANKIVEYLNIDYRIKLTYNLENKNSTKIPADDYRNKLFDYIRLTPKD